MSDKNYFEEFVRRPFMFDIFMSRVSGMLRIQKESERDSLILSCFMFAGQKIQNDWTWINVINFVEETKHKLVTEERGAKWKILSHEELEASIRADQPRMAHIKFAQEEMVKIIMERKKELMRMLRALLKEPKHIDVVIAEIRKSKNWRVKGVRWFEIETLLGENDTYMQLKNDRYVLMHVHTKRLREEASRVLGRFGVKTEGTTRLSIDNRSLEDFLGLLRRIG